MGMDDWMGLIFEYLISASAVAVGWSSYSVGLLTSSGINLPVYLTWIICNGRIN